MIVLNYWLFNETESKFMFIFIGALIYSVLKAEVKEKPTNPSFNASQLYFGIKVNYSRLV